MNVVRTGTPGIGKSVFGFYLLRRRGKTVIFQSKETCYRFSDTGVMEGSIRQFQEAGELKGTDRWYLCDPETRPYKGFTGTTVVLVSPKATRLHEFMKQKESRQFYMPVWDEDELLECREAVYSHVPSDDVKRAFGEVGGVACLVFDRTKLQKQKDKLIRAADKITLDLLKDAVSPE
ncbi:unnamed protein product, partial [Pylaiella littoralis]